MILAGEFAGAEMFERFQREAKAAARLPHAGIVQVYEVGEHDGRPYIVQEFVAGGSLAARLDEKPWPAAKAAELMEALARAVQTAHDHGIIHRDLKPENVLLTEDGQPKIADFGLAKRMDAEDGKTRTGAIMGTPSYMAPEQAGGRTKEMGPATDVYALGAILYRLLTGRPPFQGADMLSVLAQVLEQEPEPLRSINPKVPRNLETVALKCLAKEPKRRYASAEALADDLRRFVDGEPIRARRLNAGERFRRFVTKRPGATLTRALATLLISLGLCSIIVASVMFGSEAVLAVLPPVALAAMAGLRTGKTLGDRYPSLGGGDGCCGGSSRLPALARPTRPLHDFLRIRAHGPFNLRLRPRGPIERRCFDWRPLPLAVSPGTGDGDTFHEATPAPCDGDHRFSRVPLYRLPPHEPDGIGGDRPLLHESRPRLHEPTGNAGTEL